MNLKERIKERVIVNLKKEILETEYEIKTTNPLQQDYIEFLKKELNSLQDTLKLLKGV